jgi:hypothetical protein
MDFIFMLTRSDQTVPDCLEVLEYIKPLGLKHIGFKDVGVTPDVLRELNRRIQAQGATSYMEVVSTSTDTMIHSAKVGREIGIDCLLGGTQVEQALEILKGSKTQYYPFPGKPVGHPTKLGGSPADVEAHCRKFAEQGCAGVDLLAYRATEADPIDLVKAARKALGPKTGRIDKSFLIVAGSVNRKEQMQALKAAGADAFTIGSAAFDGSFSPFKGSLMSQLKDIVEACQ